MTSLLNKKITNSGITYNSLHWWLRREFGSATKCEHPNCSRQSPFFQWALLKGKEYERKRENFWQLCRGCHFKYDLKAYQKNKFDIGRLKAQKVRIGLHHSTEVRQKIKDSLKKRFPNGRVAWNKGKEWSVEARLKMSLAAKGRKPWNKGIKFK